MGRERSQHASLFMWILVAGLLSQNLAIPVMSTSFEDQKNYYTPDPHAGTPPTGSHGSPPHVSSPPYHSGGTPPSHGTPSHGGGGNCNPTPSHGTPSHGHDPTPSTPSGGGGYYHSPPTSGGGSPPVTETPPTTPVITPVTPSVPTPSISIPSPPFSVPSPPFVFDPNTPFTGTCNFWRTHPTVIWGLLGWWGTTLGGAFGATSIPGFASHMSLQQALSNTRTDGIGALYREGTASLLNSMVNTRFPYTTKQVRDNFVRALGSNKAAAAQAQLFKQANEGRLKPRA
ncbi:hypothetical protein L1049_023816 [Liquidambar formosana]|uniref:Protodermal factor 1 n=1 Tax=Liquidambar formosana TaxID=63359 RepID=A0AAP0RTQ3_LIQFO